MNKVYLLLDCNYLCHRAKHTLGGLKHGETPTGVIYGFLKTISYFQERFNTHRVVFCWDSKTNKREEIFPAYKKKRKARYKEWTPKEAKFEKAFRLQMKKLRRYYLKAIGYKNVFCQAGYESDDIIASISKHLPKDDEAIIITSDQDMYQCLRHNVSFYNPQKNELVTLQKFYRKYGIMSKDWKVLKAITGCTTDEVPGIKRVGEITALKFLKRKPKETSKIFQAILSNESWKILQRNKKLVYLPFKGVKIFPLREDEISRQGWKEVCRKLGMKSIQDKGPTPSRKRKRNAN